MDGKSEVVSIPVVPPSATTVNNKRKQPEIVLVTEQDCVQSIHKRHKTQDELDRELACPQCYKIMLNKVFQCTEGHIICEACQEDKDVCPTCHDDNIAIRNLHIERSAERLYPMRQCPNQTFGCENTIRLSEMVNHVRICQFKPFDCPSVYTQSFKADECHQRHTLINLKEHMRKYHGGISELSPCNGGYQYYASNTKIERLGNKSIPKKYWHYVEVSGQLFMLHYDRDNKGEYWFARHMNGNPTHYKITVVDKSLSLNPPPCWTFSNTTLQLDTDESERKLGMVACLPVDYTRRIIQENRTTPGNVAVEVRFRFHK